MVARSAEPLFSKSQVNRAGRLWAKFLPMYRRDKGEALRAFSAEDILESDDIIAWWRREHAYPLRMVNANLRHYVRDIPESSVTQRLKKHSTIVDKLSRHPNMDLTRMEDIGGCRITLPDQRHVNDVVRKLRKNWNRSITRHRDYVANPKPDGYRAHHLVVERKRRKVEVQVRTRLQDLWANTVEYDSRTVSRDLKSGLGPEVVQQYYRAVSELFAHAESETQPPEELRSRVNDLYARVEPYLMGRSTTEPR